MSNEAPTDALRLVPVGLEFDGNDMTAAADALRPWMKNYPPSTRTERCVEAANAILTTFCLRKNVSALAAAPASPLPGGGWQDISTAPKDEGVKVMAFDGTKVGEAVLYSEWEESNDFEDAVLRWRWANDSCSCCWGRAEPQPTHRQPLPAAPTGDAI